MNSLSVRDLWSRIDEWLKQHSPTTLRRLRDGSTASRLDRAELTLGVSIPSELRESLMIHDGERDEEAWIFGSHSLLAVKGIVHFWKHERRMESNVDAGDWNFSDYPRQIMRVAYNRKWIPFAHDGSGGYLYVDLNPTEAGTRGQVIQSTTGGH